ncbi:MAG TPA: transcriptional regulator [Pelagibacterium sp.]|uniref:winged helix-turn-helix transcriptional regulator n=1 Tax=uncultured Pelagibacterium sp. TaxID=1159875 RepID=UPI000EBB3F7F|nr:transcriptional regulator [Pelagibacterium sp.]|tara:strand:- start:8843 stop:9541 length:699 start_codon:yes stop_codon:yes gene_type:complete
MTEASYHQFCPVAMASEILGARWTIVLLRELCAGSTRFNDLRRGVPRMSPALLARRLRELEQHGVVERRLVRRTPELYEYVLTEAGQGLRDVVMAVGIWGQRWIESAPSFENTDPSLLMWDMRRNIRLENLPPRRVTVQFIYADLAAASANWWLLSDPQKGADLCSVDPRFDVDLFVRTDLRTMTAIWMGLETVARAENEQRLARIGDSDVGAAMQSWLGLSPFAAYEKHAF